MLASRLWKLYSSNTISFVNRSRFLPSILDPSPSASNSLTSTSYAFFTSGLASSSPRIHRNFAASSNVEQGPPNPSQKPSKSWYLTKWIGGILLSVVTLPLGKDKLNSFLQIQNEVEVILEDAELVVEVVEKVAEEVVKITDVLVDQFPDRQNLKLVGNVAEEIAKDANQAEDLIHKVQEVEKAVESVIEPVVTSGE